MEQPLFGVSQIAGHIRGNDMGKKGMIREKGQAASNNGGAIGNEGGHAKELTGSLTQIGNPGDNETNDDQGNRKA